LGFFQKSLLTFQKPVLKIRSNHIDIRPNEPQQTKSNMERNVKAERRLTKEEVLFLRVSGQLKSEMIIRSRFLGKSLSEYVRDLVKEDLTKK